MTARVLIVVSSATLGGDYACKTGTHVHDLSLAYYALKAVGVHVQLASPLGGPIGLSQSWSDRGDQNRESSERFMRDVASQTWANAAQRLAISSARQFDGIYFPGGPGATLDLPADPWVRMLVEDAFKSSRIIAAVSDGVAGLLGARRPDGRPIVSGRRVTAHTDKEAAEACAAQFPTVSLEYTLRVLGAHFLGRGNWLPHAVRDGALITGQNSQSSHLVVRELLHALRLQA